MAFAPVALAVAATAVSTMGQMSASNYQAAVAKNNAKIARENAEAAGQTAQEEGIRSDREYAQLAGEQIAAQSASGLNLMGKTPAAVRRSSAEVGRIAAEDISNEGRAQVRNFRNQEASFKGQRKMAKSQMIYQGIGGALSMGGSLVGGSRSTSRTM